MMRNVGLVTVFLLPVPFYSSRRVIYRHILRFPFFLKQAPEILFYTYTFLMQNIPLHENALFKVARHQC